MTVVNVMKFNDKEGAIVSDEQSSNEIRKFEIAEKVCELTLPERIMLYGGSGASNFLNDVSKEFNNYSKANSSVNNRQLANNIGKIASAKKESYSNSYLESNFSLTLADLQRGYRLHEGQRIDIPDRDRIFGALNSNLGKLFDGSYLTLTKDKENLDIHVINFSLGQAMPVPTPYACIGSGSDTAEESLYSFFVNMTREDRKNVKPVEGIAALLNATEIASKKNMGVGGTPIIAVIKDDRIIRPSEINTKLAAEIVKASVAGVLPKEYMHQAIEDLVYNNRNYSEVNDEMLKQAKDANALNMFLRGYKI
jgi:hypothetical protein